jgi:hypothetical protein
MTLFCFFARTLDALRWVDVLRCISRWELLQQIASGVPSDAVLFAAAQQHHHFQAHGSDGGKGPPLARSGTLVPRKVSLMCMDCSSNVKCSSGH